MCGIVAYIGKREAYPIVIKGLQRLEYRGYDSTGVALINGELNIYKKKGISKFHRKAVFFLFNNCKNWV